MAKTAAARLEDVMGTLHEAALLLRALSSGHDSSQPLSSNDMDHLAVLARAKIDEAIDGVDEASAELRGVLNG